MVVGAMEEVSADPHQELAGEDARLGADSSIGPTSACPAEDRLAEAVLRVIRTNGKVREAILDLVLSSPYIQWEL